MSPLTYSSLILKHMDFRGLLSFCVSTTLAFAGPQPVHIPLDEHLDPSQVSTHLAIAVDDYESARDAFEKRGPQAMFDTLPTLSKDDQAFLQKKVNNLSPLPHIKLEAKTLIVGDEIRAEVISLEGGAKIKINGREILVPRTGSIQPAYDQIYKALGGEAVSWYSISLINEAHAMSGALIALGAVGVLLAAIFGARSYSDYKDRKASEDKDYLAESATQSQIESYRQAHGLDATGARDYGFIAKTSRAVSSFWSNSTTTDKPQSAQFHKDGAWGKTIADSIRRLGPNSKMMTQPPQDLLKQCSRFTSMTDQEKTKVWTAILDALSMSESGHDPRVTYAESFGVVSRGMLQISWASARGHGGDCRTADVVNLHQAEFNLACGVKIMEDQLRSRNTLFPDNFYYWSGLSPARNPKGFERFTSRLNYLKANPDRWPASCNAKVSL